MNPIQKIAGQASVKAALAALAERTEATVELAIRVQQIEAPTFAEGARAAFVEARFKELGLVEVSQDGLHNVYGRLPAKSNSGADPVIVSAHLDTVFPAGTDLTVRRDGKLVYGPGIGDNSTGVAGMLTLAAVLSEHDLGRARDIWFVANVGEEGLGDLKGMRVVVERFGREAVYIVLEGGLFGQISHQAIGVRRFRIEVTAEGGHSWGSFGATSAIHELGRLITRISELEVPAQPKSTFNVGVIEGGTSINTIAQSASLQLDLRSEDPEVLAGLVRQVEAMVQKAAAGKGVGVSMQVIGDRPAGQISRETPLVQRAREALSFVGSPLVEFMAGSTDANIPLSLGIPAVCIGLTTCGNTHRLDEYMDIGSLDAGLKQVLLLVTAVAGQI